MATRGVITYQYLGIDALARIALSIKCDWYLSNISVSKKQATFNYNLTLTCNETVVEGGILSGDLTFMPAINNSYCDFEKVEHIFDTGGALALQKGTTWVLANGRFDISFTDYIKKPAIIFYSNIRSKNPEDTSESMYFERDEEFTLLYPSSLLTVPTITTAPNFTDEENPTIIYDNPSGTKFDKLEACISLTGAQANIAFRTLDRTGTSYQFELTEDERELLRTSTVGYDYRNVIFILRAWYGSNYYDNRVTRTFYIANATPYVTYVLYDVNPDTVKLTHNSDWFIKGYSNLEYQIFATPQKHATITGFNTTAGAISYPYERAIFEKISSNTVIFTATDNRNVTGKTVAELNMVEYFPVSCSLSAANIQLDDSGITATAEVEISGKFYNGVFGAPGEAEENKLKIEILHTGLDDWFELPDILWGDGVNGNEYKATFSVNGLNYGEAITFQARASDKLTGATSIEKTLRLLPVFDWGENDVSFNVPVSFEGSTMIDFVVETGAETMGSNGTWYWSKWKSGKAECYGTRNYGKATIEEPWGCLYESGSYTQDFPDGLFIAKPDSIQMTIADTASGALLKAGRIAATKDYTSEFSLVSPVSMMLSRSDVSIHAIGRWK